MSHSLVGLWLSFHHSSHNNLAKATVSSLWLSLLHSLHFYSMALVPATFVLKTSLAFVLKPFSCDFHNTTLSRIIHPFYPLSDFSVSFVEFSFLVTLMVSIPQYYVLSSDFDLLQFFSIPQVLNTSLSISFSPDLSPRIWASVYNRSLCILTWMSPALHFHILN